MNDEARKLYLIKALLKEDDEKVLSGVESLLNRTDTKAAEKKKL